MVESQNQKSFLDLAKSQTYVFPKVNHGDGAPRLDDSFSSEPPLSPASRYQETKKIINTIPIQNSTPDFRRGGDSSRHQVPQEKVGSSNCVHTTTHAMFVGDPSRGNGEARTRRAPLAQQELEVGRMPPNSWLPGPAWDCRSAGQGCFDRSLDWRAALKVSSCGNQSRLPHSGNLYSLPTSSES